MRRSRERPQRLATKLLALRQMLGVTQAQMAQLIDLNKTAARINEYEHGSRQYEWL